MARPPIADRDAVVAATLSVRLTTHERARLDALVAQRSLELRGTGARIAAATLARDIVVRYLDQLGVTAGPLPPSAALAVQTALTSPELPPLTAPAAPPEEPWWFGIRLGPGALAVLHPRRGSRATVEAACGALDVTLRGPFESRHAAWKAFEAETAEQEKRDNAPPPRLPLSTTARAAAPVPAIAELAPGSRARAPKPAPPARQAPKAKKFSKATPTSSRTHAKKSATRSAKKKRAR